MTHNGHAGAVWGSLSRRTLRSRLLCTSDARPNQPATMSVRKGMAYAAIDWAGLRGAMPVGGGGVCCRPAAPRLRHGCAFRWGARL